MGDWRLFRGEGGSRWVAILLLVLLCGCARLTDNISPPPSAEPAILRDERVLWISSYHPDFPIFPLQQAGLEAVFEPAGIRFDYEFMDSKRFIGAENLSLFTDLLSYKLANLPPYDLVIATDNDALVFVLDHEEDLFPGTPVVFFGVNDIPLSLAQNDNPLVTGLIETVSIDGTLALMRSLHPEAESFAYITDGTPTGRADMEVFNEARGQFPDINFIELSLEELTFDELSDALDDLPEGTPTLLISAYVDATGRTLNFDESLAMITEGDHLPLYHLRYHGIGQGVLGGRIFSHYDDALLSARMALAILDGASPRDYPITVEDRTSYQFDYRELVRWEIPRRDLPPGSTLINLPPVEAFYRQNSLLVWVAGATFVTMLVIISLLFINFLARRRTERELIKSEEKYRHIVQSMQEGYFLSRLSDGRILHTNESLSTMSGYTLAQLETMKTVDVYSDPQDRLAVIEAMERHGGRVQGYELALKKADGTTLMVECNLQYIEDEEWGRCLEGTLRDVTRRRQDEENLRLYTERLRILRQIDLDILAANSLKETIDVATSRIRDLVSADVTAIGLCEPGKETFTLLSASGIPASIDHEEYQYRLSSTVFNRLKSGDVFHIDDLSSYESDNPLVSKVREFNIQETWIFPLIAWGELVGLLHVGSRQTHTGSPFLEEIVREMADHLAIAIHQARLSEDLRNRVLQMDAIRQLSLDITALLELDTLLTTIAKSAMDLLGAEGVGIYLYEPEEDLLSLAIIQGWIPFELNMKLACGEGLSGEAWRTGRTLVIDDYMTYAKRLDIDKEKAIGSGIAAPVIWKGHFLGVVTAIQSGRNPAVYTRDQAHLLELLANQAGIAIQNARLYEATQRHTAELEQRVEERTADLLAAYEQLKELASLKDDFVSNVSHELRTPITSLKVNLYMLRNSPDRLDKYLGVLDRETERLEHLIEAMLLLSRLDQWRVEISEESFDLTTVIGEYITDRSRLASDQGLTLEFTPAESLPPITGDRKLIGQVISILLTNAFNYTPAGGKVMVKTVTNEVDGSRLVGFSITDTGPGIGESERRQLFERFYRGEAARKSGVAGTGLGLSIAKEIVTRFRGHIICESEGLPGRGTTFTVWFPVTNPTMG